MENCALTVLHKSYLPIFFKGVCKYQCTRWVNNTNLVQMAWNWRKAPYFAAEIAFEAQHRGLVCRMHEMICAQGIENGLMITILNTVLLFLSSFRDQRYHCCVLLFFAYPKCMYILSDIFIICIFPKRSDSSSSWLIFLDEVHGSLLILIT